MKRLCSVLLLGCAVAGCSNVDVQGIVRDQATGDPLPGATVRIGEDMTETDYRGFYELEVDAAETDMMVDKPGYESFQQPVSLEGIDEVIQDVDLNPALPGEDGLMTPGSIPEAPGGSNFPEETTPGTSDEGIPEEEGGHSGKKGYNDGGMNRAGPGPGPGMFGPSAPGTGPR